MISLLRRLINPSRTSGPSLRDVLAQLGQSRQVLPAADLSVRIPAGLAAWHTVRQVDVAVTAQAGSLLCLQLAYRSRGPLSVSFTNAHSGASDQADLPTDAQDGEILLVLEPDSVGPVTICVRASDAGQAADLAVDDATVWAIDPAALSLAALWSVAPLHPQADWSRHYGTASPREPLKRLRDLAWSRLIAPVVLPWIDGTRVAIGPDASSFRALAQSGVYEPGTAVLLKALLPRNGVFIDVGANVGLFTILAARWLGPHGRIVACEPSPRERIMLERNIQLNPNGAAIRVIAAAIGDHSGTVTLRLADAANAGLNTIGPAFAYGGVPVAAQHDVPLQTLDAMVAEQALSRIDVIKMDVEGAEGGVLHGAQDVLRRFQPALIIEVFDSALRANHYSAAQLEQCLHGLNYTLAEIDDGAAQPRAITTIPTDRSLNILALPPGRSLPG